MNVKAQTVTLFNSFRTIEGSPLGIGTLLAPTLLARQNNFFTLLLYMTVTFVPILHIYNTFYIR